VRSACNSRPLACDHSGHGEVAGGPRRPMPVHGLTSNSCHCPSFFNIYPLHRPLFCRGAQPQVTTHREELIAMSKTPARERGKSHQSDTPPSETESASRTYSSGSPEARKHYADLASEILHRVVGPMPPQEFLNLIDMPDDSAARSLANLLNGMLPHQIQSERRLTSFVARQLFVYLC
jgi:hypothetical protein